MPLFCPLHREGHGGHEPGRAGRVGGRRGGENPTTDEVVFFVHCS